MSLGSLHYALAERFKLSLNYWFKKVNRSQIGDQQKHWTQHQDQYCCLTRDNMMDNSLRSSITFGCKIDNFNYFSRASTPPPWHPAEACGGHGLEAVDGGHRASPSPGSVLLSRSNWRHLQPFTYIFAGLWLVNNQSYVNWCIKNNTPFE